MTVATKKIDPATATYYKVPAGTRPAKCRGPNCAMTIYFIRSPRSGSMTPIDCDVEGGKRPSEATDKNQFDLLSGDASAVQNGKGVSHFLTCKDPEMFTARNR